VLGHDVTQHPVAVRRLIGLAGQSAAVEGSMTGRENLAMVARLYGQSRRAARTSAAVVLDQLGLAEDGERLVRTYSGGMRRRLDLGASLVGSPRVLLLDEPTTGLDPRSRIELWDAIRQLGAAGTDILLTTQYLDEADQLAAHIVIVDAGRVIAQGTPAQLKANAGVDRVEVHTRDAESLARASAVLSELSATDGAGPGATEADPATRRCSVPTTDGARLLPLALDGLRQAGVTVEDITLRRPTLDEVFLALTGHQRAPAAGPREADPPSATPPLEGAHR
jgi:ABC-2 type transport system ATP-binding protein